MAAALGGVGATISAPALTRAAARRRRQRDLDNITPPNLMNIRRVAYGTRRAVRPARRPSGARHCGACCSSAVRQAQRLTNRSDFPVLLQQLRG